MGNQNGPRNEQDALIRAAAGRLGLPVVHLARLLDTSHRTICHWQAGSSRIPPMAATLLRLIAEGAVSREQVAR